MSRGVCDPSFTFQANERKSLHSGREGGGTREGINSGDQEPSTQSASPANLPVQRLTQTAGHRYGRRGKFGRGRFGENGGGRAYLIQNRAAVSALLDTTASADQS